MHRKGLRLFLRQFSPRDRVGLVTFANTANVIVPLAPMKTNRPLLERSVDNLIPGGSTAVYDATMRGVNLVASLRDSTRINAVVVLTDGEDNKSTLFSQQLISQLRRRSEGDIGNVRVFTIAYGSDANADVLTAIATASGGKEYAGDPNEIDSVYRQISSFF